MRVLAPGLVPRVRSAPREKSSALRALAVQLLWEDVDVSGILRNLREAQSFVHPMRAATRKGVAGTILG